MIPTKTVNLRGDALEAARTVHQLHLEAQDRLEVLQKEYRERTEALGREFREKLKDAWGGLLEAAGLPETELGQWELDVSYLWDHQCAFLKRSESEEEDEAPNLSALFQAATATKH